MKRPSGSAVRITDAFFLRYFPNTGKSSAKTKPDKTINNICDVLGQENSKLKDLLRNIVIDDKKLMNRDYNA